MTALVALALAAGTARGADLTLEEAVARAVSNQPLIRQAEAAVAAAQSKVGQAESSWLPNLSAEGSYNRMADHSFAISSLLPPGVDAASLGVPASLAPLLSTPFSLSPVDNWDFHLGLSQVVFRFGRGIQVELAEQGVSSARISVDQIRSSLAYQAAQTFVMTLYARERMKILDEQRDNLLQHVKANQVREQAGAATRFDVLSTQLRVSALESQRVEAENLYKKQRIALMQLVGASPAEALEPTGTLEPTQPSGPADAFVASALQNRTEVRQALDGERSAELSRQLATAAYLPTLAANAQVGYMTGILPNEDQLTLNWVVGLQLSVPIFNGLLTARQVEEARSRITAARESTAAVQRSVTTQVLQAIQDLDAARDQVRASAQALQDAGEIVEVARVQYDIGVISNLEYLDAQSSLATAKLTHLAAMLQETLGAYALRQAAGERIWMSHE